MSSLIVAFIGLGNMGSLIAKNIIKNGEHLVLSLTTGASTINCGVELIDNTTNIVFREIVNLLTQSIKNEEQKEAEAAAQRPKRASYRHGIQNFLDGRFCHKPIYSTG